MEITITHLKYFIAAADIGSIAAASRSMFISRQALSKVIHSLETELGYDLYDHDNRNFRLSKEGRRFYVQATAVLREYKELLIQVEAEKALRQPSRLSFGLSEAIFPRLFPSFGEFMNDFFDSFPERVITWEYGSNEVITGAVRDGRMDFGLIMSMSDTVPGVQTTVLASLPLYAAVFGDHPLMEKTELYPEDLLPYECVGFGPQESCIPDLTEHLNKQNLVLNYKPIAVPLLAYQHVMDSSGLVFCIASAQIPHSIPHKLIPIPGYSWNIEVISSRKSYGSEEMTYLAQNINRFLKL